MSSWSPSSGSLQVVGAYGVRDVSCLLAAEGDILFSSACSHMALWGLTVWIAASTVLDGTHGVAGAVGSIMARAGSRAASAKNVVKIRFMLEDVYRILPPDYLLGPVKNPQCEESKNSGFIDKFSSYMQQSGNGQLQYIKVNWI
jgi:hypothetical protein